MTNGRAAQVTLSIAAMALVACGGPRTRPRGADGSSREVVTANESRCVVSLAGGAVSARCTNDEIGYAGDTEACARAVTADVAPPTGAESIWTCSIGEVADLVAVSSGAQLLWAAQVGETIGAEISVRAVNAVPDPLFELLVEVEGRDGGECDEGGDTVSVHSVLLKWSGDAMQSVFEHQQGGCPEPECGYTVELGPAPSGGAATIVVSPQAECGQRAVHAWNEAERRYRPSSAP